MTPEATALVADHGFDPVYGARPLKRAIQHDLLDPLSLKLLEGDFPEGTEIVVRKKTANWTSPRRKDNCISRHVAGKTMKGVP